MADNNIIIYHNPRCSKSRQTLQLLQDKGLNPTVIEYLKTPPSEKDIIDIVNKMGVTPLEIIRTKEEAFKELGLNDNAVTDDALIRAMADTPQLIERPIVVKGEKAAIGRPPEKVLEIL